MYDLSKPHLKIVSKGSIALIIQNGLAFEHGSRKVMGKIEDMQKLLAPGNSELCKHCGGTFTDKPGLEFHFFKAHKDILIAAASRHAPKSHRGIWAPDDTMIREEARKAAGIQPEPEAALPDGEEGEPSDEAPAHPKKAHREKVK